MTAPPAPSIIRRQALSPTSTKLRPTRLRAENDTKRPLFEGIARVPVTKACRAKAYTSYVKPGVVRAAVDAGMHRRSEGIARGPVSKACRAKAYTSYVKPGVTQLTGSLVVPSVYVTEGAKLFLGAFGEFGCDECGVGFGVARPPVFQVGTQLRQ
jgi:hypothetical protein